MRRTIPDQIRANIRLSLFYSGLMVLLVIVFGAAIAGATSPKLWPMGAAIGALAGIGMSLFARFAGASTILSISRAREATPYELQVVQNVTEEMAIAAGIPVPQVYVIDDDSPNAFATGADPKSGVVCITTGLLRKLNREEVQAVIAHEVGHIRNYDIRLMTTLALVAGLIPMMADFFWRSQWYGGGRRSRDRDSNDGQAQMIFLAIAVVLAILAPLFSKLLELAVSRQREFAADASAAEFTRNPGALISALQKLVQDPDPLESSNRATAHMYIVNPLKKHFNSIFSTHPSIEARVAALGGYVSPSTLPTE